MEFLHAELLVVLAPTLLSVALCLLANHATLAAMMAKHVTLPMRELLTSREHVESLLSLATNLAFVGTSQERGRGRPSQDGWNDALDREVGVASCRCTSCRTPPAAERPLQPRPKGRC